MRKTILLAAAIAAFVPTQADAHTKRRQIPDTNPVRLAYAAAVRYWGTPPCEPTFSLFNPSEIVPSKTEAGPEQAALAANEVTVGAWTNTVTCQIAFNRELWGTWEDDLWEYQLFCDEMVHEVGHLFGNNDSGQTNRAAITYPLIDDDSPNYNSVPQCRNVAVWESGVRIVDGQGEN